MDPNVRGCKYTPFYCEENVWHLCEDGAGTVVVISSPSRATPLWKQRAAGDTEEPVFWDYHVILVRDGRVFDLDTTLPFPCPLEEYVDETFRLPAAVRFRCFDAEDYRRGFGSDRSHMRDEHGHWRAPPPPWPAIRGERIKLDAMIDVLSEGVLTLPELITTLKR